MLITPRWERPMDFFVWILYLTGRKINKMDEVDPLVTCRLLFPSAFFFPGLRRARFWCCFFFGGVHASKSTRPQKKLPKKQVSAFSTVPCLVYPSVMICWRWCSPSKSLSGKRYRGKSVAKHGGVKQVGNGRCHIWMDLRSVQRLSWRSCGRSCWTLCSSEKTRFFSAFF